MAGQYDDAVLQAWVDAVRSNGVKNSMNKFVGDGVKTVYDINFAGGYLNKADILAYKISPTNAKTDVAVTAVNDNKVTIDAPVEVGWALVIYRDTPKSFPLVDFADNSIINEKNLDTNFKQTVFGVAELLDRFDDTVTFTLDAYAAAERAKSSENAAAASEAAAAASAASALASANSASTNATAVAADRATVSSAAQQVAANTMSAAASAGTAVQAANTAAGAAESALASAASATSSAASAASSAALAPNLGPQGIITADKVITGFDATGLQNKAWVHFAGRDTVGDGGGGYLRFLAGSTAPANGITVYAVNGGRLVREGWTVFGVNVKWAGAKTGEGVDVAANTAAIQAAIDLSPFNLFFPEGTYLVNSLQYYWGDTGSQATRVWNGSGVIIKGAADSAPYLVDFAGQKLRVRDIEFQGKGEFNNDYDCIWRFHTRNNTVNVNDIHFDGATARFNGKAIIYSLPTDTTARVSEVFFNGVTIKQVQRGVDVQGVGMVDSLWNNCYLTTSALPAPGNLDENYLFKINRGPHNLVGCEVMQTDLNAGQVPGWTVLFPSTASKATWNMTGGILEVKSGFSWKDGADGGVAICNNTNGYWGYVHSDPLFKVGSGCTGGINLSNARLLHDAANFQTDYGPLIVDSANSPEFRVYVDDNTLITPDDFQPLDLMTKIIGGKWNYPESQIVMAYGNDPVTVTAGNMLPIDFTTSWVDSAYTNNRLKGIYSNGVITIPAEGLQGAWIEVLVDWDQAASKCYLVRRTSALCSVTNGSDYVQLVDQQNPGNFFPLTYQLGITPTAKVTGTSATAGRTVSSAFFDSTNFRLSSAWAGSTGNVALTFEMKIGEITKGELRRYDLGDFRPGDKFFLGLEAVSATTRTTLPYQRMRLVAKSRLNAMKVNGNN